MEYNIFKQVRQNFAIPYIIRFILCMLLLPFAVVFILLPIFPLSLFAGVFLLVVTLILLIPGNKLRYVIKIRKSVIYLFQNIKQKKIIKQKFYDILNHVRSMMRQRKRKTQ